MKILSIVQGVAVIRHKTLMQAFERFVSGNLMEKMRWPFATHQNQTLRDQLEQDRFLGQIVRRPIGLVTIEGDVPVAEFRADVAKQGFEPAEMDESLAYLKVLREQGVRLGNVFHLETPIHDGVEFLEYRLLLNERGMALRIVPYIPGGTILKKGYTIIVAKILAAPKVK